MGLTAAADRAVAACTDDDDLAVTIPCAYVHELKEPGGKAKYIRK
jgi:hypothetical protein